MLFVFQVDTGRMVTFDVELATKSVQIFKLHVERVCNIAVEKQVLLISGGEYLDPEATVASYAAGTDSNPIYLFSKAIIESNTPPPPLPDPGPEIDLEKKVRDSSNLPPTLSTVESRARLAEQFYNVGLEQIRTCEKLVHEQHLQQQGWSSVVANLEDLTTALQTRWDIYKDFFTKYLERRYSYFEFLQRFKEDLSNLQRIPVLPALLESQDVLVPENEDGRAQIKDLTLLDWISQRDGFAEDLYEYCCKGLHQMDENIFRLFSCEVEMKLKNVDFPDMKEVKGIGERLSGLEQLMREAKKCVQEQKDLAQSFHRNQARASVLQEQSILPDLCATHLQQLQVLLENQNKLRSISTRCVDAKNELSTNLYRRLQWVVYQENSILEVDNKLVFSFENLQNLQRQLDILQQVHLAPIIFLNAIVEVIRRRSYSQSFSMWASDLSCQSLTIYNDEIAKRKDFQVLFEGHFLSALFPGMDDLPPAFATQSPSIFDTRLPKLTAEDLDVLRDKLPDFIDHLKIPDLTAMRNFFLGKCSNKDEDRNDHKAVEENLMAAVAEAGVASNMDENLLKAIENEPPLTTPHGLPHLKDIDKGCESETDTEEFEKVGQSPFELHFDKGLPSPKPGTQDVSTLTEVGERNPIPPKKPPRTFQKTHIPTQDDPLQRTLSISGSQSNTESFTNIKNPSLESIDELSSLKNFGSNTESCFNSHYHQQQQQQQQMQCISSSTHFLRSKSISPHTPQSPKDLIQVGSPNSPVMGHQHNDFITDEFYIDESLPSSLSIETGQSQGEFVMQLDTANNVVALLQDNLQISRSEHDKLRSVLMELFQLAIRMQHELKHELNETRSQLVKDQSDFNRHCTELNTSWIRILEEKDNADRELIQGLTVDHELEISDFRKNALGKSVEIKNLLEDNSKLTAKVQQSLEYNERLRKNLDDMTLEIQSMREEFEKRIEEVNVEKDKAVKEVGDQLRCEHKGEIENIRARFKLMTMERSPSENSLEKIERADFSSIANHEAVLLRMTENFKSEKEVAVSDAVAKEAQKWQKIMEDRMEEVQLRYNDDKEMAIQEVTTRILEDKDKQIEILREHLKNLQLENIKFRSTLHQLVDDKQDSLNEVTQRIEGLQHENDTLKSQLEQLKDEKMTASVAVLGSADASTSQIGSNKKRKDCKISLDHCNRGNAVLVLWESAYQNYRVLIDAHYIHFVHWDCLEALGLEVKDGQPNKTYCFGEVIEKECCSARKDTNRFRVPIGTKFFRVKLAPVNVLKYALRWPSSPRCYTLQQSHMSQSQTAASTTSEIFTGDGPSADSLPSSPTRLLPWEVPSEMAPSTHSVIFEEKGEDSSGSPVDAERENLLSVEESGGDIEKGTELTENFNVEIQASIDR